MLIVAEVTSLENKTDLENDKLSNPRSLFPPDLHRVYLAIESLPDGLCKNYSQNVLEAVVSHEKWALQSKSIAGLNCVEKTFGFMYCILVNFHRYLRMQ